MKQAPTKWNKSKDGFLTEIGFIICVSEHVVYVRKENNKGVIILCLNVDDLLIRGSSEAHISEFIKDMMRRFEMTDLGHISYFPGIEFHRSSRGLLVHQRR